MTNVAALKLGSFRFLALRPDQLAHVVFFPPVMHYKMWY